MASPARVGDPIGHPGVVSGPGVPHVLIGGMPAVVVGDIVTCAFPPPAVHPPTPLTLGSAIVLIGGRPAVRLGDISGCSAPVVFGMPTVIIG